MKSELKLKIKLIKQKSETMNSISNQILDFESRRKERLRLGRTADELLEYLDKFFPSLLTTNAI